MRCCVEARRVIVEQPRDIGLRQRDGRVASPNEREPGHRALRIGGIGDERFAKGLSRRVEVAELLPRFAKREPRGRPMGRALERLLEQLRRRAPVALFRRGFGVSETALGDEVARRERIARHASGRRRARP